MFYPVYVHKDEGSAYGMIFPDLPDCFSAADELEDIPRNAQEAVECYGEEEIELPSPSDISRWKDHPDYQGGFWMLIDINLEPVNVHTVRVNVSLPSNVLARFDYAARAAGMSRSAYIARLIQAQPEQETTAVLEKKRSRSPT